MHAVGEGMDSEGSDWIIKTVERTTNALCGCLCGAVLTVWRRLYGK